MIRELRNRVNELNEAISGWERQISGLQGHIDEARAEIRAKTVEIERLETEARRTELIGQLTEALSTMSVEQLAGLVSALQNGETPTVEATPVVDHGPTVMPESPRFITVNTRAGDIAVELPENRSPYWMTADEFDILESIPSDLREADYTIAGVRHQELFTLHHYVPQIGELVRLEKETETSNCYGILIASDINELEEDMAIGVFPAAGRDKERELRENDLPCVTHQDMWNDPDLDELYEVTGVVIGKYVTIRKVESVTPATEEEEVDDTIVDEIVEEDIPAEIADLDLNILNGTASTPEEAARVFRAEMPDHCTLSREFEIEELVNHFIVHYDNHTRPTMESMRQAVLVEKVRG